MRTRIVRIGNSQGVRISKVLLEESGLSGEVEITAEKDLLIVRAVREPRAGWSDAFKSMAENGDDALLIDPHALPNDFDKEDWLWT